LEIELKMIKWDIIGLSEVWRKNEDREGRRSSSKEQKMANIQALDL